MSALTDRLAKADAHATNRIREGHYIRFIEPSSCPDAVRSFLAADRYWFGAGAHVSDTGIRRRLNVHLLDVAIIDGAILAIVQVRRDRIEPWMQFPNRKVIYHLATAPVAYPHAISDGVIRTLSGQRLHWYLRKGLSPLYWLTRHDPTLTAMVLRSFPDLATLAALPGTADEAEPGAADDGDDW